MYQLNAMRVTTSVTEAGIQMYECMYVRTHVEREERKGKMQDKQLNAGAVR